MNYRVLNNWSQLRYMKLHEHRKVVFADGHTLELVRVK